MAAEGENCGEPAAPRWQQTAHGKGRVRPRRNQPLQAQAEVPRLAAVAHA